MSTSAIKLTQDEEKYQAKVWHEIEGLLRNHLTPEEQEALKNKVFSETLEQVLLARREGTTPFQMEQQRTNEANREIERIRQIELNGYVLELEDFWGKFQNFFNSISFFPSPQTKTLQGTLARNAIYNSSSPAHKESEKACGELLGICDPQAVQGFSKVLRSNYEALRKSKILGYTEIRAINVRHVCKECQSHGDRYIPTDALLKMYELGALPFPHELPSEDEARWCSGPKLLLAPNDLFGLR